MSVADASKVSLVTSDARCLLSHAGHPGQMHTLGGGQEIASHLLQQNKAAPQPVHQQREPLPRARQCSQCFL